MLEYSLILFWLNIASKSVSSRVKVMMGPELDFATFLWERVSLHSQEDLGKFTFETTLKANGEIIFAYKDIPQVRNY